MCAEVRRGNAGPKLRPVLLKGHGEREVLGRKEHHIQEGDTSRLCRETHLVGVGGELEAKV